MGCGTGLVGKYLADFGFKHVDGIDASAGMLKEAEGKRVYKDLSELFLGQPDTYPQKFYGRYDFVTASGILADNHLDCRVFDEMLLSLKTGGICVFATRTQYLTEYHYAEGMQKLVDAGKWELVK